MTFAFDRFTVDPLRLELCRDGERVHVQRVPLELLVLLLERAGALVDRGTIEARLWGGAVHVDAEHGINTAVRKLRRLLDEDPDRPRFIQTVVGQGYRFIAPVREASDPPQPETPATGHAPPARAPARPPTLLLGGLAIAAAALAVAFIGMSRRPPTLPPTVQPHLSKITIPGNEVLYGFISPDGREVAYVADARDGESLWVRGLDAPGAGRRLVARVGGYVWGVTYTPAGDHLYYVVGDADGGQGALYRVPTVGGLPERLLTGINGAVQFDPAGARMIFKRAAGVGQCDLVMARADGSDARSVASSSAARPFQSYAWSSEAQRIFFVEGSDTARGLSWEVRRRDLAAGGEERLFALRGPSLGALHPLGDGRFLAVAADPHTGLRQVWSFAANGERSAVTLDTHDYALLTVARDGRTALATKWETQDSLWIAAATDRRGARTPGTRQVLPRSGSYETPAWAPGGGILFALLTSLGRSELWWMSTDGTRQRRLRSADADNSEPAASPDGRFVVFTSDRDGSRRIWRMELEDDRLTPLTPGPMDGHASVSASGRWVTYAARADGRWWAWIVPAGAGPARRLTESTHEGATLSPDESRFAYAYPVTGGSQRLAIRGLAGGDVLSDVPLPPSARRVQWTSDGKGLTYLRWQGGSAELWLQPLRGAARRLSVLPDEIQQIDRDPKTRRMLMLQRHLRAELVLINW